MRQLSSVSWFVPPVVGELFVVYIGNVRFAVCTGDTNAVFAVHWNKRTRPIPDSSMSTEFEVPLKYWQVEAEVGEKTKVSHICSRHERLMRNNGLNPT